MFRDSRGVVHTVSSADPLADLPGDAAEALRAALLRPGDLGGRLEECDAVRSLLDDWQTAFFASLPGSVDLAEEALVAAEAGLSLEQVEAESVLEDLYDTDDWDDEDDDGDDLDARQQLLDLGGLDDLDVLTEPGVDDPHALLSEELVSVLERALLLLPMRVRLEALTAAEGLVDEWEQLLADHEKLLGHLVLVHGRTTGADEHQALVDDHAARHAATGPGH